MAGFKVPFLCRPVNHNRRGIKYAVTLNPYLKRLQYLHFPYHITQAYHQNLPEVFIKPTFTT